MKGKLFRISAAATAAVSGALLLAACAPEQKPCDHTIVEVAAKAVTCIDDGYKKHFACTDCGDKFFDEYGNRAASDDKLRIPALGHEFSAEWSSDENGHWHECVRGDVIDAVKEHGAAALGDPSDPDCDTAGSSAGSYCPTCGFVTEDREAVHPLGHKYVLSASVAERDYYIGNTFNPAYLTVRVTCTECELDRNAGVDEIALNGSKPLEAGDNRLSATVTLGDKSYNVEFTVTASDKPHVHTPTPVGGTPASLEADGVKQHFACDCDKLFLDEACTQETTPEATVIPRHTALSSGDGNVTSKKKDGTTFAKKTESGKTFVGGNPNDWYQEIEINYNISSSVATKTGLYLDTSSRVDEQTVNKIYYVVVNGVKMDIDNSIKLPKTATPEWLNDHYTYIGDIDLKEGDNDIKVVRLNLLAMNKGNNQEEHKKYTYNFFGIKLAPETRSEFATKPVHIERCDSCGKRTDAGKDGDDACAGHADPHTEFNVMDNKVEATTNKDTRPNEQNISCNGSSVGYGTYTVTYYIDAAAATTAKFYIKVCAQRDYNDLRESYSFRVNGVQTDACEFSQMPYRPSNNWGVRHFAYVGEITLRAGVNTIEIIRPDNSGRDDIDYREFSNYNFFGIALDGGDLTLVGKPSA